MGPTAPTIDELVAAVSAASPDMDEIEQRLAVILYRRLAEGEPVSAGALAQRSGVPEAQVARTLAIWPGVFLDEARRVIGFRGLALLETPHRYKVDRRQLYTWCAWDTLFITSILNHVAEVESSCPVTGRNISLTVAPQGIQRVEPTGAVLSFLSPAGPWADDAIATFCHYVLFFASPEAGVQWAHGHAGTFLLSMEHAFELGQRVNRVRLGSALDTA